VTPDTRIRNGDSIGHYVVRYEPAVVGGPIQIVKETEDLVVINKPSSIPVCFPTNQPASKTPLASFLTPLSFFTRFTRLEGIARTQ